MYEKKSHILGLILILFLLISFGCSGGSAWEDGSYTGVAEGVHGDVEMGVEIEGGKISDISVISQHETAGVSDQAFVQVPDAIIKNQDTEVDVVAGATISSNAVIGAVEDALSKANK